MDWIALKMLLNDRAKFWGLLFTIAFVSFLITQQVCVFCGIINRTTSQIRSVRDANIWVVDPFTQYIDETQPLSDTDLYRVRGVPGVEWAVPLFKNLAVLKMVDGRFRSCIIMGVDDATLVGAPLKMIAGNLQDLDKPNAMIMDKAGYAFFFPGQPIELGKTFELNDHRAFLVGICDAPPPFQTMPIIYAKYSDAINFVGNQRRVMSFVLAKSQPGIDATAVARRIEHYTHLKAFTQQEFTWATILYYLKNTGIPINFGLTISIAVLVGLVVAGQTFYLFVTDNLRNFATLKAIGTSHSTIIRMVVIQALTVGILGYCMGMGMAGMFFHETEKNLATRGLVLLWQAMASAAGVIVVIICTVSIISLRKVLKLEAATVFRS